jgi:hypothetical protein
VVDVGGVSRGGRELAVVGQQGKIEGLGQGDVHSVVGTEVMSHLEYSHLQRLHRVTDNPQAGVVGEELQGAVDGDPDAGLRGDGQAADDAGDFGIDEGGRVDGPSEPSAEEVISWPIGQQTDNNRAVNDAGHRRSSSMKDRRSSTV